MKHPFTCRILPWFSMGMGGLIFALRSWLYRTGTDENGLFQASHPAMTLSFVLTAVFLGLLMLCIFSTDKTTPRKALFPKSLLCAVGSVAGGAGILPVALSLVTGDGNTLSLVAGILGFLAAASLAACGFFRWKGQTPPFLFHGIVTVFLLLYCICQYRQWGAEPQLNAYFFQLLACILLTCYAYQRAAIDSGSGNLQLLLLFSQGALFFSLATIPDENGIFFFAMAVWCATGTPSCSLKAGGDELEAS